MTDSNGVNTLTPTMRVTLNGSVIPQELDASLLEANVFDDVDTVGMFTLVFTCWDSTSLEYTRVDDETFAIGTEILIEMGFLGEPQPLIYGEITGLEPEFREGGMPLLLVRGYDLRHRFMRGQKTRAFLGMKDSEMIEQIAGDLDLMIDAEDSSIEYEHVMQHNQSDLDFVLSRAKRIGYELAIDGQRILFRPRLLEGTECATLSPGKNLIEFGPRMSCLHQATEINIRGWSFTSKGEIIGTSDASSIVSTMDGRHSGISSSSVFGESCFTSVDDPVATQEEADISAKALLNEMALKHVRGYGISIGNPGIRAGSIVRIEGVGERFSGLYYIASATHVFNSYEGYRTKFVVRRTSV